MKRFIAVAAVAAILGGCTSPHGEVVDKRKSERIDMQCVNNTQCVPISTTDYILVIREDGSTEVTAIVVDADTWKKYGKGDRFDE